MNAAAPKRAAAHTHILDGGSLEDRAQASGFALLRTGNAWRLYERPREVVAARDSRGITDSVRRIESHVHAGGEAAGFLHYEAGYALEPRLRPLLPSPNQTLLWFGLDESAAAWDDVCFPAREPEERTDNSVPTITQEQYNKTFREIQELIAAGEAYQINFTYPVRFHFAGSAWGLFTQLCRQHPVPYAAFLNTGKQQIVSLSPELYFNIENGHITVKPMKGTAPRALSLSEDDRRGRELSLCEKKSGRKRDDRRPAAK